MIELSNEAYEQALILRTDNTEYNQKSLRLYIEGKGCDGFYYGVTFDEPTPEDIKIDLKNLNIIIDPDSYIFCEDVTIQWVDDERGKGFLVENHNQKKFKGKFYKRQAWQDKLLKDKQ